MKTMEEILLAYDKYDRTRVDFFSFCAGIAAIEEKSTLVPGQVGSFFHVMPSDEVINGIGDILEEQDRYTDRARNSRVDARAIIDFINKKYRKNV